MALIPRIALPLLALLSAVPALAQTAQPSPAETQLNVLAHDPSGHPLPHLTAADFHLTLNGQPVPITRVDEHTAARPTPPIQPLSLPPGTFADVTPIAPSDTVNILVLDALNTPPEAEHALQAQLQQLAQHPPVAAHLAIFGLTTHLILLQDFTTGPTVLKDAVDHKLIPRGQALLDTTHDLTRTATAQHDLQLMQLAANLHLFETTAKSVDRQFRQQYTLDALHALATYLASLPGHKNILWLAPSFPVTLAATSKPNAELTRTAALLNAAGASIYPINARPILTPQNPTHPIKFLDDASAEHAAMQQLASTTGGVAILNPTSLQDAITRATQLGSDYYTLTFTTPPITPPVQLNLTGPASATLIYPHEAVPPASDQPNNLHAAMARGAPAPEALPFKVRVLPATTAPEPTIAPGNQQDPSYKIPGPWQRYEVDFAALAADITLTPTPSGEHTGKFEALAYIYDIDGRILNTTGQTVTITLTPAEFDRIHGSVLNLHLEISVPLRQQSYLRLALHDIPSDRTGVIEIPVSAVSHLPAIPSRPEQIPPSQPGTPSH